jgi:hypothetical protein
MEGIMARSDPRDIAFANAINRYKSGALQQFAGRRYKDTGEPIPQPAVMKEDQAVAIALSMIGEARRNKQARPKRVIPGSTAKARRQGASGGLGKSGGGTGGGGGGGW